jgi:hypothetical protein
VATLSLVLYQTAFPGAPTKAGLPLYVVVNRKVCPACREAEPGLTWKAPSGRLPPGGGVGVPSPEGPVLSEQARSRPTIEA